MYDRAVLARNRSLHSRTLVRRVAIADQGNQRVIVVDRTSGAIVWQFGETGVSGGDSLHLNAPIQARPDPYPTRMVNGRISEAQLYGAYTNLAKCVARVQIEQINTMAAAFDPGVND